MRHLLAIGLLLSAFQVATIAAEAKPTIYIEPQGGFESYISAAIVKKGVPVSVTVNKESAQYHLTSAVEQKEESGASN